MPPEALVGSPLKKARSSIDQGAPNDKISATQSLTAALGSIVGSGPAPSSANAVASPPINDSKPKVEEEEEL